MSLVQTPSPTRLFFEPERPGKQSSQPRPRRLTPVVRRLYQGIPEPDLRGLAQGLWVRQGMIPPPVRPKKAKRRALRNSHAKQNQPNFDV